MNCVKATAKVGLTFSFFLAWAAIAQGQIPRPVIPQPPIEVKPLPEEAPDLDIQPSPLQDPEPEDTVVYVTKFLFRGNTVISTEELNQVAEPFLNKQLTIADLKQLRSKITEVYISRGYINSVAIIATEEENQELDADATTVLIDIFEGEVEQFNIEGTNRSGRRLVGYVQKRLERAAFPLNQQKLLTELRFLQSDPLIKQISAQLLPGSVAVRAYLDAKVLGNPTWQVGFDFSNTRSPSIGEFQAQAFLSNQNFLGLRDQFTLYGNHTDGANGYGLSYRIPLNSTGLAISFRYDYASQQLIEDPFDEADFFSRLNAYELELEQNLLLSVDNERLRTLRIGLRFNRTESKSSVFGIPFPTTAGADDSGELSINSLRLFTEYRDRARTSALLLRGEVSQGLPILGYTSNSMPDAVYTAFRVQGFWIKQFPKIAWIVRGDLQLGDDLPGLEQIGLGGFYSVRGYRSDQFVDNSGFSLSTEWQLEILQIGSGSLKVTPFIDGGAVWGNRPSTTGLLSIGAGLLYQHDWFQLRLNYAYPFLNKPEGDSWQDKGLSLSVSGFWQF